MQQQNKCKLLTWAQSTNSFTSKAINSIKRRNKNCVSHSLLISCWLCLYPTHWWLINVQREELVERLMLLWFLEHAPHFLNTQFLQISFFHGSSHQWICIALQTDFWNFVGDSWQHKKTLLDSRALILEINWVQIDFLAIHQASLLYAFKHNFLGQISIIPLTPYDHKCPFLTNIQGLFWSPVYQPSCGLHNSCARASVILWSTMKFPSLD